MKEKPIKKTIIRRDGPISLYPLTPEQALSAFMKTPVKARKKTEKRSGKKEERK